MIFAKGNKKNLQLSNIKVLSIAIADLFYIRKKISHNKK